MDILDWFHGKKRNKEVLDQFEQMERMYESVKLEEGRTTDKGGVICPHCSYEMSQLEYLEQWQPGAVRIMTCPHCQKEFKTH